MTTQICDDAILLRRYQAEDVAPLYEAVRESAKELHPWLPWCHENYELKDSFDWVLSRDLAWDGSEEYSFVILDARSKLFLGGIGLNQIDKANKVANLGYWVRSSQTKNGIATRATILAAQFGLFTMELQRIEIVAAVGNIASQRAAAKAGASREGILRKRILLYGKAHDAVIYSLVAEDLLALSTN
jgi:RimJ/RimL family protein N-acetyltransferase